MTIDRTIHMQAELEAVDNTSWTGDETTIVSNQQSMLTVWDIIKAELSPISLVHLLVIKIHLDCCLARLNQPKID